MRALSRELVEIRRIAAHLRPARRLGRLALEFMAVAAFVGMVAAGAIAHSTSAPIGAVMIAEAR
ncbi:hypothetical protein [Aureimonas sp. AU12]|uniref:hypothetical protein n=1 Tax=Aureimonas sp. AU12 TaxID=1638161 RepID=UPI000781FED8|nr:hypothetical protein [Aureimonas sp. AU12]